MKPDDRRPGVSVIVPVLHEEARINTCLMRVRECTAGESIEIIVVDGDPEGGTISMIDDKDVTALCSSKGRGAQMNRGAKAARGDILVFLHADTVLPGTAFGLIEKAMAGSRFAGGAFDLAIDSPRPILRLTARAASWKHRITRVPYGDQAIFIRRAFFRQIGGFREMPLFEDVELMRRIKKLGGTIVLLPQRARTSARKWEKDGILFTIFRNWALQILHLMGASPEYLVKHYYKNE